MIFKSQDAPTEPILRIETGMHTAMIRRIAVDQGERFLVTASDDKVARVWDLATGRLLTTLRPPIGADGYEGRLNAVAISPDGATVALGGWTGPSGQDKSIYLFDRASGQLRHRIPGLPNVILHLAWSRDGHHLAATLWGANGLRVFRTQDWQEAGRDQGYGGASFWADFDAQGRLVTSCWDGFIRLYDPSFRLITQAKAPGGKEPFGVAFSPDGGRIAVGFDDTRVVNLLDGKTLALRATPDTTGVDNGAMLSVVWSADGRWLFAGGGYDKGGKRPVRRWEQGGEGKYQDFPVASDIIIDLRPLAAGRLAFGAADPLWGVMDGQGQVVKRQAAAIADFRGMGEGFRLSRDGQQVAFGLEQWGNRPARFSLNEGRLELDPESDASLSPPRTQGLAVTDWFNTLSSKLNDKPLELNTNDCSRSLAITPDGQGFLLGASWTLYHFDKEGKERWRTSLPGVAWGVNVSHDGRLGVAALSDGTIRWYRMGDGKELLALFPHTDGKRWVAWTPAGYYQAGPGGEELIGWHINQGKEKEGQFFAASRFRSTRSRPDVVARVLEVADPEEALRLADADLPRHREERPLLELLPPVVTLLSPVEGATFATRQVTLRFRIVTRADAPVTGIHVLVDGRTLEKRVVKLESVVEYEGELEVTLPRRDVTLGLLAENRHGFSALASARLIWNGVAFVIKPKLYVLAIGVSNYLDDGNNLMFPVKDAVDFANVLKKQENIGLYQEVVTNVLSDADQTQVLDGLEWLEQETTAKDVAMLFLAGHGVNDRNGDYFFIPSNGDPARLMRTAVSYAMIKDTLVNLPGKTMAFLDTCHSGNAMGARGLLMTIDEIVNDLVTAENGVVVFASSTGKQLSWEREDWGNGAFTKALVEGLSGKANCNEDGCITIKKLEYYLSERVKELTNNKQTPTTAKPSSIPDYPLAIVR